MVAQLLSYLIRVAIIQYPGLLRGDSGFFAQLLLHSLRATSRRISLAHLIELVFPHGAADVDREGLPLLSEIFFVALLPLHKEL